MVEKRNQLWLKCVNYFLNNNHTKQITILTIPFKFFVFIDMMGTGYWRIYVTVKVKVKQSHYRPGQALRVPGGWGSQISRQSAHEGGKVVSPTHRPPLPSGKAAFTSPPRKYSWYSFLLQAESTPGPQCGRKDYVNEKSPVTPSGIEPVTFRLVAHCLNQLRHRVPLIYVMHSSNARNVSHFIIITVSNCLNLSLHNTRCHEHNTAHRFAYYFPLLVQY
jgi:hypothetical protein